MGCTHTVQCLVAESVYDTADDLIQSGEFGSFSELANYSIRLYCDSIRFGLSERPFIRPRGTIKKTVRVDTFPLKMLTELCNIRNSEVADYALDWYFESVRNGKMEPTRPKTVGDGFNRVS